MKQFSKNLFRNHLHSELLIEKVCLSMIHTCCTIVFNICGCLVTGWVILKCTTSTLSRGEPRMSYFSLLTPSGWLQKVQSVTVWTQNVLLPSCHGDEPDRVTFILLQDESLISYSFPVYCITQATLQCHETKFPYVILFYVIVSKCGCLFPLTR